MQLNKAKILLWWISSLFCKATLNFLIKEHTALVSNFLKKNFYLPTYKLVCSKLQINPIPAQNLLLTYLSQLGAKICNLLQKHLWVKGVFFSKIISKYALLLGACEYVNRKCKDNYLSLRYLSQLLSKFCNFLHKHLWVKWKFFLKNNKQVCSFLRDLRVC